MQAHASTSEDNGITALTDNDLVVYSVGISTGGVAEIRMAELNPRRHITATTIDEPGVDFARQHIIASGLEQQIKAKLEDATQPLPYDENSFDYVYARLVLYYLPEQRLVQALSELHRILKPGGRLFVVVRSTDCPAAQRDGNTFDPVTHLTTFTHTDKASGKQQLESRFFHTEQSISQYVAKTGFEIQYIKSYDEQLFVDFERTIKATDLDNVIELLAVK